MALRQLIWCCLLTLAISRPLVRNIRSTHEFDRLLEKHATETGMPVIVDFYSDSCGPCRMMAPIFKKVAQDYTDKAVFVKVDTNAQYELSQRYQIRSLPTFQFFIAGQKVHQAVGGIGEQGLRQEASNIVRQADLENVVLTLDSLKEFYHNVDNAKPESEIASVHNKCVAKNKVVKECFGTFATQLTRKLKKKYGSSPKLVPKFTEEDKKTKSSEDTENKKPPKASASSNTPNLHLATKEQLLEELERRADRERDQEVEEESTQFDEEGSEVHRWQPSGFPERMVIIGGGPAGMASAIYGARAGLSPLVIAPSMGGQLQGKGVDVENYPGLHNMTGPGVVALMRQQAAHFGAVFEDDIVVSIDASSRPFKVVTNSTGAIEAHTIVVATGADSNWLGVPGEYELRGGGVSSCATCDGFLYSGKDVLVIGGGDSAMEDALVLARTSKQVTIVHRRDQFRASKILSDRVLNHPNIIVKWNTILQEIIGNEVSIDEGSQEPVQRIVTGARLKDTTAGEETTVTCDAVFIAIGHTPNTKFLEGIVDFDENHQGYVVTLGGTTETSVPGIFAAGDVADAVYRQAITSAGSGAAAALDAERFLSENGLGNEEANLEAELIAELMEDSNPRETFNVYDQQNHDSKGSEL